MNEHVMEEIEHMMRYVVIPVLKHHIKAYTIYVYTSAVVALIWRHSNNIFELKPVELDFHHRYFFTAKVQEFSHSFTFTLFNPFLL